MLDVLTHPAYGKLFAAQAIALVGTGLMSVALGLLAYDLAGTDAGVVLGTVFAIKMVAYVGFSPVAHALIERLPRKAVLIAADLVRASVAVFVPFIDAVWQVYLLIFVLQAASAAFAPAFQAVIPDILKDDARYTRALSLTRLAYDLENLASPALAGLLLTFMNFHGLFAGTVAGFLGSAVLVWLAAVPPRAPDSAEFGFADRLTRGLRLYLATARLRGLLALSMAAAAPSAFVLVNTVVIVRVRFGGDESAFAVAMAAFGAGSMLTALILPRLLERISDRTAMLTGAGAFGLLALVLAAYAGAAGWPGWNAFLALWALAGMSYAAILTPSGRLLRRSGDASERPSLFVAQFALSHACWLVTYPLAGWVGGAFGLPAALGLLGAIGIAAAGTAAGVWPKCPPAPAPDPG